MASTGTITIEVKYVGPNVCPGCGRCRDCGQPASVPAPLAPWGPYYPASPYYTGDAPSTTPQVWC